MKKVKSLLSMIILASLIFSSVAIGGTTTQIVAENQFEIRDVSNSEQPVQKSYGKTPLLFEANKGQADKRAKFISRAGGYTLYLAETEAVFQLRIENPKTEDRKTKIFFDTLRMKFVGASAHPSIEGIDESITKTNYYTGKKRFENAANYSKAIYKNLYDKIDAVFYGSEDNQLEYDFRLAPNADADQIRIKFDGAENVSTDEKGNLIVKTANTRIVQQKPFAYQEIGGERKEIASRFVVSEKTVEFELGEYDKSQTLVIDPAVRYLSYLGGTGGDFPTDIKIDAAGNVFMAGSTGSTNFPGPNAGSGNVRFAAFVSKISADGGAILYTTFLDGTFNDGQNALNVEVDRPDLAIDAAGQAYIAGGTDSDNFPVTSNAFQKTKKGCSPPFSGNCNNPEEGFVAKLDPQGALVYSTFLGGRNSDYLHSIAVDSQGRAYVAGATFSGTTFPTKNQFQGTGLFGGGGDAFLTVFNADGSDIIYSTALGGINDDIASEVALDSSNNVYVTGFTSSGNFPVRNAFQSVNRGGKEVFAAKFNAAASGDASLIYSTYIGGAGTDKAFDIAVDENNQAVITGITGSFNYPLLNEIRGTNQVNEAFVTVLSASGSSLVNSTFLGGSNQEAGNDLALGVNGTIYVAGTTSSADFPVAGHLQATNAGGDDAFITKLNFGSGILFSTYLGGSDSDSGRAIDVRGKNIVVSGASDSVNLPATGGAFQPNPGGNNNNAADGFVAKISDKNEDSVGVFRPQSTFIITQSTASVVPQTALFTSFLAGQKGVSGDFDGDGITTIGSFTGGTWKIRNSFVTPVVFGQPVGIRTINFGAGGDLPIVGDWNGDGIDTPGVYRVVNNQGQFTLTNSTGDNPSFVLGIKVNFGLAGDLPVAGDWDGDGKDSIALFRPSTGETFFANQIIQNPPIDFVAFLGISTDLPIAGDWNGDGKDSLGLWRPSTTEFFLSDDNVNLRPVFLFGANGDQPIAGDWDGKHNQ